MTTRVSQQILLTSFITSPTVRVTSVAIEVIRSTVSSPLSAVKKPSVQIIGG